MRLIDADAFLEKSIKERRFFIYSEDIIHGGFEVSTVYKDLIDAINEMPTIDPVKHGYWLEYTVPNIICCSECDWGTSVEEKHFNYCPNCGARMDGDK